ncbi:acetyltransferase domain containing protein [uncultured Caudovirales phage]|uniref:Acetyltransferase domain containing protein n=1 Tax=uncultured Caudovirales phage TaxID=2100421 RepID=A0A6J5KW83_9CAUD|nr:acetyltransferase domain containing protein [uncultured Caudovirales phage]
MGLVTIRECSVTEFCASDNLDELFSEYAAESSIEGLPVYKVNFETYKVLDQAGVIKLACAYSGDVIVGFISVLVTVLPHYSETLATVESFFVAKQYRAGGAGLRLLRWAETLVQEAKLPGLLVSAPAASILSTILPKLGYNNTNLVFFKKLPNA